MSSFYVMFPLSMFSYRDEELFIKNNDSLLVYFILGKLSNFHDRNTVFCNVSMLSAMLQLDNSKQRLKQKIVSALEELESKGYISIESNGQKLQTADLLTITINEDFKSSQSDQTQYKGFEKVTEELFKMANFDGQLFKVLIYIQWRQRVHYFISYAEWGNVLGKSERSAISVLKKYEEQGLIQVERGHKERNDKGQIRQFMNLYNVKGGRE